MDQITVTENISYFSRIKGGFKNIIGGIICIFLGIGLLRWNEGRAVQTQKSLEEGQKNVVIASGNNINTEYEGKLIHIQGDLNAPTGAKDDIFPVAPSGAIVLLRTVSMYQRKEESTTKTNDKIGGGQEQTTTYTYSKTRSENDIDSSQFKNQDGHINPPLKPYSLVSSAEGIKAGAYKLYGNLISEIKTDTEVELGTGIITSGLVEQFKNIRLLNNQIYIGTGSPDNPNIGDKIITFKAAFPHTVSIIAKQQGDMLSPYQTNAGDLLAMMSSGIVSATVMFQQAIEGNKIMTWMMRGLGTLLVIIGFAMLFSLLATLGAVIPMLGNIIGFGTGLLSLILGFAVSILVIAIAWIRLRPVLGVGLIALVVVIMVRLGKKKQSKSDT